MQNIGAILMFEQDGQKGDGSESEQQMRLIRRSGTPAEDREEERANKNIQS